MAGVSQLSDGDLTEELRWYGVVPGPIIDSTREVYQNKLAKLMAEKTKVSSKAHEEETDYANDQMGSPRFGSKKQHSKTASQSSYMAGVSQLSDGDLAEELRRYGMVSGPIIDSTRGVYQNKLANLWQRRQKCPQRHHEEETDYPNDQMGEWSSHSSEGETDLEEQQEDGEEGEGEGRDEWESWRIPLQSGCGLT